MSTIKYQKDDDNIVHIIFDRSDSMVNLMDLDFADDLTQVANRLLDDDFDGVILRSTKSTFFAGGDLAFLSQITDQTAHLVYNMSMQMKEAMRRWETCGKPVVACINGSALGGGFELALACHHRISLDSKTIKLGLPEVNLGLLPGAGGLTRMVRLLGLEAAMPYLSTGRLFSPEQGMAAGLIDELVKTEAQLLNQARQWIKQHAKVQQPYDVKSYKLPGGTPNEAKTAQFIAVAPAVLRKATHGTLPAPEVILSAMVEGAQVDFATAERIESRYFTQLTRTQVAKNLISTFWFGKNTLKTQSQHAEDFAKTIELSRLMNDSLATGKDNRTIYVSRLLKSYVAEGLALLSETKAASIENAAWCCGFTKGPNALNDEFALYDELKSSGFNFSNQRPNELHEAEAIQLEFDDIKDRLLFSMALQSVHCYEDAVITLVAEANLDSIYTLGYPRWTGGTLQYINQYPLADFVARANQLADNYGERFRPSEHLLAMAKKGQNFV